MFAGEGKSQLTVANQCQLLALRIMNGVKKLQTFGLITHFARQVGHSNCFDVNCSVAARLGVGVFHRLPFLNLYGLYNCLWFGAGQVHVQQPIFYQGLADLDAISQNK